MDVQSARTTQVAHLRGVLTSSDIERLHETAASVRTPKAVEARAPLASSTPGAWTVLYMHTEGWLERLLPDLHAKLVAAAHEADKAHWQLFDGNGQVSVRCAEYHRMAKGGSLADPTHYDLGSLVTLDVMLTVPGKEFEGGTFCTREADGHDAQHPFGQGDAVAFVSHKPHHVTPVTRGVRQVLVLEFWRGPPRRCPHRCDVPADVECDWTLANAGDKEQEGFEDAIFGLLDMDVVTAAMEALAREDDDDQEGADGGPHHDVPRGAAVSESGEIAVT